ncbi:MAG: tRNA(Cytosine32)-2-thiocytidine synthetase [Candidatus Ozemobacter sibiricus]|jgi:tRNA(Ile)-lysidine synthase TilS/MesJ|uniref:tRNA(Cytosine32)-2-thiocytidine synthetase n=1 Tax=Candidatus Ozemobacter sibiricus TaxID=2268124 RepID=A0A367ZTW6_9BACT|nr:MAG: tRNA(Cytosine32)-2-thiocytidine synthetase [Candidatus Ozemobacter sibiricus]
MELSFDRHFGKWFVNDVLRVIKRYGLIEPGERVAVALSGGKDSVLLLYVLRYLQRYSPLRFDLTAIHIRAFVEDDASLLREFCRDLQVEYLEEVLDWEPARRDLGDEPTRAICSVCARLKRGAMAALCEARGIARLAYGHHATDAAETLLMNLCETRRLSSFTPRVEVPGRSVQIIRPLIALDERTVAAAHRRLGLPVTSFRCRYAPVNRRADYKALLGVMAARLGLRDLPRRLVDALDQADPASLWANLRKDRGGRPAAPHGPP